MSNKALTARKVKYCDKINKICNRIKSYVYCVRPANIYANNINMNVDKLIIDDYLIKNVPNKAYYIPDFISVEEEKLLINHVYSAPKPKWTQLSNRRLQNWGGIPHIKGMIIERMPQWLQIYIDKINGLNLMSGNLANHVLINEYLPNQGIMPHFDGSLFYPTITTISLGSHTVLNFLEPIENEDKMTRIPICSLLIEPRSLLILQADMFSKYMHCIEECKDDIIDDRLLNLNLCSPNIQERKLLERTTRISLTIRHVPKATRLKILGLK